MSKTFRLGNTDPSSLRFLSTGPLSGLVGCPRVKDGRTERGGVRLLLSAVGLLGA